MRSSVQGPGRRSWPPISRVSSVDSEANSFRPSGRSAMPRPTTRKAGRSPIGAPSNTIASRRAGIRPAMLLSSVLLPAPFAPMIATTRRGAAAIESPNSAWKSPRNASSARTSSSGASGIGLDPHIDLGDGRRANDGLRRALRQDGAAMQNREAVDHREQRMDDMLDPNDRDARLPDVTDQRHKRRTFMLGEAARDLV